MNTYCIQLGDKTYQCRNNKDIREVLYNGQFGSCEDFVQWLMDNGEWDALNELVKFGYNKVKEEIA